MTPVQARMCRAAMAISLRDLAKVMGVSAQALGRYEHGDDSIGALTAQRLEQYYREQRIYCGPGQSVSVDQDALAQERFLVIAYVQLLHEAGVHPTSGDLLSAFERATSHKEPHHGLNSV